MKEQVNRAQILWLNWLAKQKELEAIPNMDTTGSRALIRQEYDFLRKGLYRIGVDAADRERLFVKVIEEHVGSLHRKLFPNRMVRAVHGLKTWLIDRPIHLKAFRKQRATNLAALTGQLNHLGFAHLTGRIEKQLDYESASVYISATGQLNGETRVDYNLQLEKDKLGAYRLDGFDAALHRPGELLRHFYFDLRWGVTAREAANLLEGRAVKKGM
jgi:hypothetical protein